MTRLHSKPCVSQSLGLGSKNTTPEAASQAPERGDNYFLRPAGYSLLMQFGMRLALLVPTANACSLCPSQIPFYKAAPQSVHLQHVQDFSPVFAELGETPGNAFLQPVLVPLSQQPCPPAYQFLPWRLVSSMNLLIVQAFLLDQIISSADTKLHLPQNLSLGRTAISKQLWDGFCTANHNLSGLEFQPVFHPPYNLLILSTAQYFDW